jgi:hypothetical protein
MNLCKYFIMQCGRSLAGRLIRTTSLQFYDGGDEEVDAISMGRDMRLQCSALGVTRVYPSRAWGLCDTKRDRTSTDSILLTVFLYDSISEPKHTLCVFLPRISHISFGTQWFVPAHHAGRLQLWL